MARNPICIRHNHKDTKNSSTPQELFSDQKKTKKGRKRSQGRPCTRPRPSNLSLDLLLDDGSEPWVWSGAGAHPGDEESTAQRHRAVASRGRPRRRPSPSCADNGPAWAAAGAKDRLLATEPVFLLKFMRFCRSVLHLIRTTAFLGSLPIVTGGRVGRGTLQAQGTSPPPEGGERGTHFLPALPLPAPLFGFRCCGV